MKEANVGHVLLVGGAGGALSWLFTLAAGLPRVVTPWWAAAAIGIPLGAGAAFVGVYLANSSPAPPARCLAFALLCGFSWRPVLEAGSAVVAQKAQMQQARLAAAPLLERAARVQTDLGAAKSTESTVEAVREAGSIASGLVATSGSATLVDPDLAAKLQIEAARTLTVAARQAAATNDPAVAALPIRPTVEALAATRAVTAPHETERARQLDQALASLRAVGLPQ